MSQQSQADFLSEVVSWTKEACLSNMDSTLPAVIKQLENVAYIEHGIRALQVLCDVLVPCIARDALEEKVFHNISKHVCQLVDGALDKIQLNLEGALKGISEEDVGSVVEECLQWTLNIGTCLESCIKHTMASVTSTVELSLVQSLPQCALHFLRQVYKHCKESSKLYGGLLDLVSETLSHLFKKAHSVQMMVLGLLDKVCLTGAALEDQVLLLGSACSELFEVCALVTSLDVKLSISIWKCISRLCSQHLTLLRDRLDVCPFINFLCGEIKEGYRYLFQLSPQAGSHTLCDGDDKAFSKTVRILGFQMKVLVALLRDFSDYLGECEGNVLSLLLHLHRYLPPSLSSVPLPDKQDSEVRTHVVNATVPCLTHLVGNRAFRSVFTQDFADHEPEDLFPKLLLRLMLLDILPKCEDDVVDMWLRSVKKADGSSVPNLLSAIFSSVKQCRVEMQLPVMLPGVVLAGQPQKQVSLYEHTITHLCGMLGACPATHFNSMESTFLIHVLDCDDLLSVLAVDCWCFLARYETASVCNAQVQALVPVYSRLIGQGRSTDGNRLKSRLAHLLSRLLKFLSPEHQISLVQQFPPETHQAFWLGLNLIGLATDLAQDLQRRLAGWALGVLTPPRGSVMVRASQLFLALQLLEKVLCNNCHDRGAQTYPLISSQQAQLLLAVIALWSEVQTSLSSDRPHLPPTIREKLLIRLLPLSSHLLSLMETKDLLAILLTVETLTSNPSSSPEILVACAHFMSGFSCVRLGCSYLDCRVLDCLPGVFHPLLQNSHPMVHQLALAAFSQFALLTSHEDAVPACLRGDESLVQAVQNYVNQVPHHPADCDFQLLRYLRNEEDRLAVTQKDHHGNKGQGLNGEMQIEEPGIDRNSNGEQSCKNTGLHSEALSCLSEPPTKRRRAISESDEEETDQSTRNNIDGNTNPVTPHLSAEERASSAASLPITRISTTLQTISTEAEGGQHKHGQLQSLLGRLQQVAGDLRTICRGASPPSWFIEQVLAELTSCKESISPDPPQDHTGWLDNLS
ncbi:hypothetical protein RRG08_013487 [Elysia crispata]|uniref:Uncharacterized protein n=1 Tax=Elysia crispata TaxID=231223 RepID=A0AAE0Y1J4_9GAST|nr:hypothetical protein RRG08_013487 [Elysia crispata]